jgi:DNA-binding response OmpR family regulator
MAKVLIIEDDVGIATLVADHLAHAGHTAETVADGAEALVRFAAAPAELLVLDVMLPGRSGIDVCRDIRAQGGRQPLILMLTARSNEADVVAGLEAGADDYVRKPFGVRELLARIEALLRITRRGEEEAKPPTWRWGELQLDVARRETRVGEREVKLTRLEFDLLCYLGRRPQVVVSRESLLSAVWGYEHAGYARTVDSHVTRVRRKLRAAGLAEEVILTVHASGYQFEPPQVEPPQARSLRAGERA